MNAFQEKFKSGVRSGVVAALLVMILSGCGSVQHKMDMQSGYVPVVGTKIEIGKVSNESGQTFDVNVEQLLTDALTEKLGEKDLLWKGQGNTKLLLSGKIVEYEKGNAFKRWLMPGWGSTVLNVKAELKKGDQLVGTAEARRTIVAGGGFTIGEWNKVFRSVAGDIVEDLNAKIPK